MPNVSLSSSPVTDETQTGSVEGTIAWRELLAEATTSLASVSEDPSIDARRIIEAAAGLEPAELVVRLDDLVTTRAMAAFDRMVGRRKAGEPLQYVVGSWGFRFLDLMVDSRVLIPRPETEVVAGLAIDEIEALTATNVADLGTGSGAIALALATECEVFVWATDVSSEALAVARANLGGIGRAATRVTLTEGSWFEALPAELCGQLGVIVSNPPYVCDDDPLPTVVADWEPGLALFSGVDGLDSLRHIIAEAPAWLTADGSLVLEMAPQQTSAAVEMCIEAGFVSAHVYPDNSGRDRAVVARLRPPS